MPEIERTDEEWRALLSPEQYMVLRHAGTERPWSGEYVNEKADGTYHCAGCEAELFASTTKYDSHCGWPSFFEALSDEVVTRIEDRTHGMLRAAAATRTSDTCFRMGRSPRVSATA
jgi:peptide-methionine (R)-S-oxide reductase